MNETPFAGAYADITGKIINAAIEVHTELGCGLKEEAYEAALAWELTQRGHKVLRQVPFGGGCVNDTVVHLSSNRLPFGGVGQSGMGRYHGRYSFDTFTHEKAVVLKGNWPDIQMRYPPFSRKKLNLIKKFLR